MLATSNIKKFGLISSVLFSIILITSIYFIQNCSSFGNCGFISTQIIHFIFISIGVLGTAYCLLIVKNLDDKVDKELIENYKELIEDKNINGAEKQDDKKNLVCY